MAEGGLNPDGFADRLRLLMDGFGFESTRQLGEEAGVSHGTIANWLSGKGRASDDELRKVANVFGWSVPELYFGTPARDVMTRVAELEAFKAKARRLAEAIAEDSLADIASRSSTAGYTAVTRRDAKKGVK